MKPKMVWSAASLVGLAFLLTWSVCCESPGRRTPPTTSNTPAPEPASRAPEAPPTPPEPGAPPPAAPRPPAAAESAPPEPEEPEPPDYVTVTERFHDNQRSRVNVKVEAPDHLTIDTRNVRRLRIDRSRLPLRTNRSIILRLDGQGIEWTAKSTTVEFERSINGLWMPVPRDSP